MKMEHRAVTLSTRTLVAVSPDTQERPARQVSNWSLTDTTVLTLLESQQSIHLCVTIHDAGTQIINALLCDNKTCLFHLT